MASWCHSMRVLFQPAVSYLLKQVPPRRAQSHSRLVTCYAVLPSILILQWSLKKTSSSLFLRICLPLSIPSHLVLNTKYRIYFFSKSAPSLGEAFHAGGFFHGGHQGCSPAEITNECESSRRSICGQVGHRLCLLPPWVCRAASSFQSVFVCGAFA